jgi:CRP-like cAMP-binding protein
LLEIECRIAGIIRPSTRERRCAGAHRDGIVIATPRSASPPAIPTIHPRRLHYVRYGTYLIMSAVHNWDFARIELRSSMNVPIHDISKNQLLAALPNTVQARLLPHLESVQMPLGAVLYESGGTLSHVYFPTTAIVSLLYVMENGASAEIAVVGNEGIVGISLFMGGESTPSRAVVQSAGQGFRLKSAIVKDEFNQTGSVLHLLLRYTQALITQMAQTAVCNRHHSLDQQLCRWLLLSLDRLSGDELLMTQELIANMLGVRREGVTESAMKLQNAGLIRYARGRISVLDRAGLEKRTCECYAVVKKEYERLLPEKRAG